MTDVPHRRDAAHAAEEPGVLSEYGNDTGFAQELLDAEEETSEAQSPEVVAPGTEDH
jgi:hypothetical protein